MIELSNAYPHEKAVMIVFMDASITFIAMLHSYPFIEFANLTQSFFFESTLDMYLAMIRMA